MKQQRRFCPKGHDKDAPGGSIWTRQITRNGTVTRSRQCTLCNREQARARARRRAARRKAAGMCVSCGKEPISRGSRCEYCILANKCYRSGVKPPQRVLTNEVTDRTVAS